MDDGKGQEDAATKGNVRTSESRKPPVLPVVRCLDATRGKYGTLFLHSDDSVGAQLEHRLPVVSNPSNESSVTPASASSTSTTKTSPTPEAKSLLAPEATSRAKSSTLEAAAPMSSSDLKHHPLVGHLLHQGYGLDCVSVSGHTDGLVPLPAPE